MTTSKAVLPNPLPPHPRLLATPEKFEALRAQIKTDAVSALIFSALRRLADQFVDQAPVTRTMIGRRLLDVSRRCLRRVLALGMVGRLTGEERYIERAIAEMQAAAGFEDWNPMHFLDVGEMTLALAIGYDWLWEWISEEDRKLIENAIIEKGLKASYNTERVEYGWWISGHNNWTQVCHAGMVAGSIAVAELEPELAERTLRRAIEKLPGAAVDSYAPDGAYQEGPIYWDYGTSFHVVLVAALEALCGQTFGLEQSPGFLASAAYINQATGPTGRYFNYCDASDTRALPVGLFWFANHLKEGGLLQFEISRLEQELDRCVQGAGDRQCRLLPLALLWWDASLAQNFEQAPLHWQGRGVTPVAVHRSAWNDPCALFVGIKGGSPSSVHAHMDVGSFVLDAGGERWAVDLDKQDYTSLETAGISLWDMSQGSDRWKVFRSGSDSHNIIRFDGADQEVKGKAEFVRFDAGGLHPHSVVDLSPVYAEKVAAVTRGVYWIDDRNVLLQDEWTARDEVEVSWQMLTYADVTHGNQDLTLRQNDKTLHIRILEPETVQIEVKDVSKPARSHDVANPGVCQIVLRTKTEARAKGIFRILFTVGEEEPVVLEFVPALEWSGAKVLESRS